MKPLVCSSCRDCSHNAAQAWLAWPRELGSRQHRATRCWGVAYRVRDRPPSTISASTWNLVFRVANHERVSACGGSATTFDACDNSLSSPGLSLSNTLATPSANGASVPHAASIQRAADGDALRALGKRLLTTAPFAPCGGMSAQPVLMCTAMGAVILMRGATRGSVTYLHKQGQPAIIRC
eukprot:2752200-Prymnesium_polylepis.2